MTKRMPIRYAVNIPIKKKKNNMHCAIIAAGEGSRLAQEGILKPKPLIELDGRPMIARLIEIMAHSGAESITVAIRDTMPEVEQCLSALAPTLPCPLKAIVCNTPSSMHSFHVVSQAVAQGPLILTTVDTIFRAEDFEAYARAFEATDADAFMAVTDFIDDEKPLYIDVTEPDIITSFRDSSNGSDRYISGGIYGLRQSARNVLDECISTGVHRMRNYQRALLSSGLTVKAYPFSKIIDVDHAADIDTAKKFITETPNQ